MRHHHYFSRNPRQRRVQLDLLLLEIFGARYLPDEVACRIAARAERETAFMHGINKGIARQELSEARWRGTIPWNMRLSDARAAGLIR